MTEKKIQLDLVILVILFLTVFGWFISETLSARQPPEEFEVLQILGDRKTVCSDFISYGVLFKEPVK